MKFRHEYKHLINYSELLQLKNRLGAVFEHDGHSGSDGTYYIKSLYFDDYSDKALREKLDGVSKREKFRIRYYDDDLSFIRLEKKTKINGLCNKECAVITAEECKKITEGDTSFLLKSDSELLREFYAKMKYKLLRPKCVVGYRRECFVYSFGNVRVTLDSEISGSNNIKDFLNPDLTLLGLYHNSVLEVKWDEYLPSLVCDCVQLKNRQSSAFSKYAAVRF